MKNIQAFPRAANQWAADGGDAGMTLRDYFAAKAVTALLGCYHPDEAAQRAYFVADAMLRAREA